VQRRYASLKLKAVSGAGSRVGFQTLATGIKEIELDSKRSTSLGMQDLLLYC